jgi:hypothetical protein
VTGYDQAMADGEARYCDALDRLEEAGLPATFTQTGGMNAALQVLLDGGHTLLVTDAQCPLPWDRNEQRGWGVGLYPPDRPGGDGECLAFDSTSDSSLEALAPLARRVLDDYLASRRR